MNSKKKDQGKLPEEDFAEIFADGAEMSAQRPQDALEEIFNRLDQLELALEQVGQQDQYLIELTGYIKDLRSEVTSIKRLRFWSVVLAVAMVGILIGSLICAMFYQSSILWELEDGTKTAFVLATVAGSIVIITVLLRGVFRSSSPQSGNDLMPENLKSLIETAKDLSGK